MAILTENLSMFQSQKLQFEEWPTRHENFRDPIDFADGVINLVRGKVIEIPNARLQDHAFDEGTVDAALHVVESRFHHRHARCRLQDGVPVNVFRVDGSIGVKCDSLRDVRFHRRRRRFRRRRFRRRRCESRIGRGCGRGRGCWTD